MDRPLGPNRVALKGERIASPNTTNLSSLWHSIQGVCQALRTHFRVNLSLIPPTRGREWSSRFALDGHILKQDEDYEIVLDSGKDKFVLRSFSRRVHLLLLGSFSRTGLYREDPRNARLERRALLHRYATRHRHSNDQ
jgi:hypothetical protein